MKINDLKNLDKNKIKSKVEIKKENENFKQIYEGDKYEFIIKNLNNNTKYEIRICSLYNDVSGLWSESLILTTKNAIDSNILSNSDKKNEFLEKIYEWSGCKSLELLYRELEMVCIVKIFMKNVMTKDQQLLYLKMIKEIFLEDFCLFPGKIQENI